jgi:hypothetical protein
MCLICVDNLMRNFSLFQEKSLPLEGKLEILQCQNSRKRNLPTHQIYILAIRAGLLKPYALHRGFRFRKK